VPDGAVRHGEDDDAGDQGIVIAAPLLS
jgi:hypothetical protein